MRRRDLSGRADPIVAAVDRRERNRLDRIRLVGVVLDSIARRSPDLDEIRIPIRTINAFTKIPVSALRIIGRDHFSSIVVPGKVVGYDRGSFYLAGDDGDDRFRAHPFSASKADAEDKT